MATNDGGKLYFSAGIDTAQIKRDAEKIEAMLRGVADTAQSVSIGDQLAAEFGRIKDEASATAQAIENIWSQGSFGIQSFDYKGDEASAGQLTERLMALEQASREAQDSLSDISNEATLSTEAFARFGEQIGASVSAFQAGAAGMSMEDREAEYQRLSLALQEMGSQGATTFSQLATAGEAYHQNISALEQAIGALIIQQQDEAARNGEDTMTYQTLSESLQVLQSDLETARASFRSLQEQQQQVLDVTAGLSEQQAALDAAMQPALSTWGALKERLSAVGQGITDVATRHGQFQESMSGFYQSFSTSLQALGISLPAVQLGLKGMLASMRAMIATPLGAVITAIAIALQAVTSWFKKSSEGQKAFAVVSGYVGSILSSLKDVIVTIGKALYDAFAGGNAYASAFGASLVKTITSAVSGVWSLLKGLGNTIKGIFTFDWDTFKQGLADVGQGLLGVGKTAVSAVSTVAQIVPAAIGTVYHVATKEGDNIAGTLQSMGSAAKENARLSLQQKELELERVDAERQTLEIQKEIAEERTKIYGMELGSVERQKAIEALQAKTLAMNKAQQEVAQKEADILKRKNELHASTIEDLAAEAQARNKVLRLQVQAVQSQTMLARMAGANQRSMARGGNQDAKAQAALNKATDDYIKAMTKAANERVKIAGDLADRIADAEIAAMEDATERVKAERAKELADRVRSLEKERDKELAAEKARIKEEWEAGAAMDKASGGEATTWDDSYYEMGSGAMRLQQLSAQYDKLIAAETARANREQADKEAAAMRDYLKEYGDYLEKRQALKEEYDDAMAKAETEGERKTLTARYEEEVASLNNEELKESLNWDELFTDLSDKSVAALEVLKQKILEVIATNKELSAADAAALNEQVEKIERAQDAKEDELWDTIGMNARSAGDAIKELGLEGTGVGDTVQNLAGAYEDATGAMKAFAQGDYLGALAKSLSALKSFGAVFGIGGLSDENLLSDMERLTESNQSLESAIDNLAAIMGESTTTLAEAKTAYETQLSNYDELQSNYQEQLARSGAAYDSGFLGIGGHHSSNYYIDNALSASDWEKVSAAAGVAVSSASEFWSLTSEQMYNVATYATTQYDKIKQAADDGAADAAQYMDDYIALWEELEEIQDAYYEKLTSYSFDDITSEFQSMLSDMESSTADFTESFEEMMINAIVNSMMSDVYAQKLEDWYQSFVEAMEDSELSSDELAALQSEYESIAEEATEARDALLAAAGLDDLSSSRSGASSGITQASQDSVDEMNARLTTMQGHTYSLNENTKLLLSTSQAILSSVLNIETDTGSMDSRLSNIESKVGTMSSTLSDIQLRGLVLRA